jgi:SOS-response transcriptional repressor LexA
MAHYKPDFGGISAEQAGQFLLEKREAADLTQAELGEAVQMANPNYLPRYEKGRTDWRESRYVMDLIRVLKITAEECREKLGLDMLLSSVTPSDTIPGLGIEDEVKVPLLGSVAAMVQGKKKRGKQSFKPQLVSIPSSIRRHYKPEDIYALLVTGESMVDEGARRSIPEGYTIAIHRELQPRRGDVVVAWIPDYPDTEDGLGVLKVFTPSHKDDVVLDSYNRQGLRLRAADYPNMELQGVFIGAWYAGRKG